MLDATMMTDPTLIPGGGKRGQDPDHRQSPHEDSANSLSLSPDEQDQGQGREVLWDILCTRDARDQIENCRQQRDRADRECHNMRDYDFHGPYYDQPARYRSLTRGRNEGGIKPFSHNLRRVRWTLNFKPLGIDKYDGSTNLTDWLEVYQLTIESVGGDSYVMVNLLPIYLSSSARTWLMGLLTGSVRS
jgi:hypothetical protein